MRTCIKFVSNNYNLNSKILLVSVALYIHDNLRTLEPSIACRFMMVLVSLFSFCWNNRYFSMRVNSKLFTVLFGSTWSSGQQIN